MARDFARAFYKSAQWKHARESYITAHPLCEPCLKSGRVTIGQIVHHIVHLSPENINDHSISLSFDNLETVCRDCHAKEHPEIYGKDSPAEPVRYAFDEDGNLIRPGIGGLVGKQEDEGSSRGPRRGDDGEDGAVPFAAPRP